MEFVVALATWYNKLNDKQRALVRHNCLSEITVHSKIIRQAFTPNLCYLDRKTKHHVPILPGEIGKYAQLFMLEFLDLYIDFSDRQVLLCDKKKKIIYSGKEQIHMWILIKDQKNVFGIVYNRGKQKTHAVEVTWVFLKRLAQWYNALDKSKRALVKYKVECRINVKDAFFRRVFKLGVFTAHAAPQEHTIASVYPPHGTQGTEAIKLQNNTDMETEDLQKFLIIKGIDREIVAKISVSLRMKKTRELKYLSEADIQHSLTFLDTKTTDRLLQLAEEVRSNST
jgi:hypothetical protein